MSNLRHAVAWASAGQYAGMAINLASVLILARLLAPAEYGVVLIAGSIISMAEAIRELAGTGYLVREQDLSVDKIRSTTTLSALVTVAVVAAILLAAEPLADFFAMPALTSYLGIAVLGYALGPFVHPQMALFSREFAFRRLAMINLASTSVAASVAITLAHLGMSSASLAWSSVAGIVVMALFGLAFTRDISIYCPSLAHWRSVLTFGSFSSTTAILGKINETLPVFIVGKFLSAEALAIGQRAFIISLIPERIVFAAVGPVALPELSRRARQGVDLKAAYIRALAFITVLQWPAMILVATLAEPIVRLLLGPQWLEAAPIARILIPALLLTAPIGLQYPILVAAGAVHRLPRLLAFQVVILAVVLLASAPFGLHAVAWSTYLALPATVGLSLFMVHNVLRFEWRDLRQAAGHSALVTLTSALAPLMISLASPQASLLQALAYVAFALLGAAAGWLGGIYLTDHPIKAEMRRSFGALMRLATSRQAGNEP